MSKFDDVLYRIKNIIDCGCVTKASDWLDIMASLVGEDDIETIQNIYHYINQNFSFNISENAEEI